MLSISASLTFYRIIVSGGCVATPVSFIFLQWIIAGRIPLFSNYSRFSVCVLVLNLPFLL